VLMFFFQTMIFLMTTTTTKWVIGGRGGEKRSDGMGVAVGNVKSDETKPILQREGSFRVNHGPAGEDGEWDVFES
jgi:hypothetical protein